MNFFMETLSAVSLYLSLESGIECGLLFQEEYGDWINRATHK
jgi:hypothetical protein